MSKDPKNPGVDLCITQLLGEGMVGTTWLEILQNGHLSLNEGLNSTAKKGPHVVTVEQPHTGVATCRGPSFSYHTPSWVGGRGDYP
jgi:hypothetical protein